jgi:hypothetical protein
MESCYAPASFHSGQTVFGPFKPLKSSFSLAEARRAPYSSARASGGKDNKKKKTQKQKERKVQERKEKKNGQN